MITRLLGIDLARVRTKLKYIIDFKYNKLNTLNTIKKYEYQEKIMEVEKASIIQLAIIISEYSDKVIDYILK